jgi:hypothetical protein
MDARAFALIYAALLFAPAPFPPRVLDEVMPSRAKTRPREVQCQRQPFGVGIPLRFNSSVIARQVVKPSARTSPMTDASRDARNFASCDLLAKGPNRRCLHDFTDNSVRRTLQTREKIEFALCQPAGLESRRPCDGDESDTQAAGSLRHPERALPTTLRLARLIGCIRAGVSVQIILRSAEVQLARQVSKNLLRLLGTSLATAYRPALKQ